MEVVSSNPHATVMRGAAVRKTTIVAAGIST